MSMRLFSRGEFIQELIRHGFVETNDRNAHTLIFLFNGEPYAVPFLDRYEDYIVDALIAHAKGDVSETAELFGRISYAVTETTTNALPAPKTHIRAAQ